MQLAFCDQSVQRGERVWTLTFLGLKVVEEKDATLS